MKVTYWVADDLIDLYPIRRQTRREVFAALKSQGLTRDYDGNYSKRDSGMHWLYSAPYKVSVEYTSGFDLLAKCLAGGTKWNYWEKGS